VKSSAISTVNVFEPVVPRYAVIGRLSMYLTGEHRLDGVIRCDSGVSPSTSDQPPFRYTDVSVTEVPPII
jgi:hypothetical protein